MAIEDSPRSNEHDANALLYSHAVALIANIGQDGYSGTLDLPINLKTATDLRLDEELRFKYMTDAPIARGALSLSIGAINPDAEGRSNTLGVTRVSLPLNSRAVNPPRALCFERVTDAALLDQFMSTVMYGNRIDEPQIAKRIPFVDEIIFVGCLRLLDTTCQYSPTIPKKLRLDVATLLDKAETYSMHREKELPIDPVLSLRIAITTNRFFETGVRVDPTRGAGSRSKKRAANTRGGRTPGSYRHNQILRHYGDAV